MMVRVGADTREMERGLSAAQKRIKAFRANINQAGKRLLVAGAAVTAAVGLMVKKYVEAGDAVQKMALRTGFSTEALSELKHAAELGGTSLEGLEKAVRTMQKAIVQAEDGLKTYVRGFERMGIKVKDLKGLKPEEQFLMIAEAVAEIEDATVRSAAAQEIFGSRMGTQLLPMLADGAEGLRKAREEAHKLNIVFSQESADAAAKFQDSTLKLKRSFDGLMFAIAEKFIPLLTSMADHFTDVFVDIRGNTKSFVTGILGFFKILAMGIHGLGLAWTGFKALVFTIAEYAGKVMQAQIAMWTAPLRVLAKIPGKLGEPARMMLKEVGKLTGALTIITDGYNESADEQAEKMATNIEKYEAFIRMLDKVGGSLTRLKSKTKETTAAGVTDIGTLAGAMDLGPAVKKMGMTLDEFKEWYKAWLEDLKAEWQSAMDALFAGSRAVTSAMDSVFGQFHENEAMRIDNEEKKQTDAIENWYEQQRARIEEVIVGEEEKVAALEALDEEKARRENTLQHKMDLERRKLERKRARAHKVSALFSAGINMAEAIVKAFTAGPLIGQILAGVTAALCGIQIAAIAAAPLPALKKGGFIEKGGAARVHPGELVVEAAKVKPLTGPAGMIGMGGFTFSPTVHIHTKTLDDYAINSSAEKLFAAWDRQMRRRGYSWR